MRKHTKWIALLLCLTLGLVLASCADDLVEDSNPSQTEEPSDQTPNVNEGTGSGEENHVTHEWGEGVITTQATHTAEGIKTFTCACGETKTEAIAVVTDHVWAGGRVTTEPTHTTDGEKTFACMVHGCFETITEPIAHNTDHEWNDGEVTTQPTHTTEGVKTFACTVHGCNETKTEPIAVVVDCVWDDGKVTTEPTHTTTGIRTYTCGICGDTYTEPVEKMPDHEFDAWSKVDDDTHKRMCACGEEKITAHEWDAGRITVQPTDKTEGKKVFHCPCGAVKTEKLPPTDESGGGNNYPEYGTEF